MATTNHITETQQALIVAMELLRRAFGDETLAVLANTHATQEDFRRRAEDMRVFMEAGAKTTEHGAPETAPPPAPGQLKNTNPNQGKKESDEDYAARKREMAQPTPTEKKLQDRANDPDRREANAQKRLASQIGQERSQKLNANPLSHAIMEVAGKFAAIIGPSAILAQILSSTTSGFGVLQTSVKVLAGAIAPILLPATLSLSALFLGLSEVIEEHESLMDQFFDGLDTGVEIVAFFLDVISSAADHVEEMTAAAKEFADWVSRHTPSLSWIGLGDDEKDSGAGDSEKSGGREKADRGLRDALQSLRQSVGPKASITGISDVGRQAQMAALNADPLEARLLREQLRSINRIEAKMPGQKRPPRVYDPGPTGAGDYDRGSATTGGGGDYGGAE